MAFRYIKMHVHDVHFQYSLDEKDKRWVNNDRILIFGWNTALTKCADARTQTPTIN